jgi:SNF2 family DNA or RNA helicase
MSALTFSKVHLMFTGASAEPIHRWYSQSGSVLVITYDLMARLVPSSSKKGKKGKAGTADHSAAGPEQAKQPTPEQLELRRMLLEGPSVVVADEAHTIKNKEANRSQAMSGIATSRRLALTGYPLQNNLDEYYTMICWVQPEILGSAGDFKKDFEVPIRSGQAPDAERHEKRAMNKQLSVLNQLTQDFINRRGPEVLAGRLPKKLEFVLKLVPTAVQQELYELYLELCDLEGNKNLLAKCALLKQLLNSPAKLEQVLVNAVARAQQTGQAATIAMEDEAVELIISPSPAKLQGQQQQVPEPFRVQGVAGLSFTPFVPGGAAGQEAAAMQAGPSTAAAAAAAVAAAASGPAVPGPSNGTAAAGPAKGRGRPKGKGKSKDKEEMEQVHLSADTAVALYERIKHLKEQLQEQAGQQEQGQQQGCAGLWSGLPKVHLVQQLIQRCCVQLGEKLVVFSESLQPLDDLEALLRGQLGWALGSQYLRLDGSTSKDGRQRDIQKFQVGPA